MRRKSGFTLIEILVVVIIIGILASLTLVGVVSALNTAKRSNTEQLILQLSGQLEAYRVRWGDYPPTTLAEFKVKLPNEINSGIEAMTACLASQDRGGQLLGTLPADAFSNVDNDRVGTNICNWFFGDNQLREILDLYRQPLIYIHHKDYSRAAAPLTTYRLKASAEDVQFRPVRAEQTKTYANPDKFQLLSAGKDGVPGTADDIGP